MNLQQMHLTNMTRLNQRLEILFGWLLRKEK
jgi:hypothetical protein